MWHLHMLSKIVHIFSISCIYVISLKVFGYIKYQKPKHSSVFYSLHFRKVSVVTVAETLVLHPFLHFLCTSFTHRIEGLDRGAQHIIYINNAVWSKCRLQLCKSKTPQHIFSDIKPLGNFLMQEQWFGHFIIACFSAVSLSQDVIESLFCVPFEPFLCCSVFT